MVISIPDQNVARRCRQKVHNGQLLAPFGLLLRGFELYLDARCPNEVILCNHPLKAVGNQSGTAPRRPNHLRRAEAMLKVALKASGTSCSPQGRVGELPANDFEFHRSSALPDELRSCFPWELNQLADETLDRMIS